MALEAEGKKSGKWIPRREPSIYIYRENNGQEVEIREFWREQAAWYGITSGIIIHKKIELVKMTCRKRNCPEINKLKWKPRRGLWKLNYSAIQMDECVGEIGNGEGGWYIILCSRVQGETSP